MQRKICLITGATDGVGKATATELARQGFQVVMVARDAAKADRACGEIRRKIPSADVGYLTADLGSLEQVFQAARQFKATYPRLDVLINNAGIFALQKTVTRDGFEQMFQVNYLSHFLLTLCLLDCLARADQGRIVNLSSSVHTIGRFDSANLLGEKRFSTLAAYAASKLFMLMFTMSLAERLKESAVTVNAVHPGIVRSQMQAGVTGLFKIVSWLSLPFSVSPRAGADTSVFLASSPSVSHVSGAYFVRCRARTTGSKFNTAMNRQQLWELSEAYTRRFLENRP